MSDLKQAAEKALEVLESLQGGCTDSADGTVEAITVWCPEVIESLRAALAAEPSREPVAWKVAASFFGKFDSIPKALQSEAVPLFAAPAAPVVPDVGQMVYQGNSVSFIYDKMRAYRSAIGDVWEVLKSHGYPADGETPVNEMVLRALAAAPTPSQTGEQR